MIEDERGDSLVNFVTELENIKSIIEELFYQCLVHWGSKCKNLINFSQQTQINKAEISELSNKI